MFGKGDAYDLWWTGQEFKDMRVESCEQMLSVAPHIIDEFRNERFDLAIGHFHDLCPLALAEKAGISKLIWITHGTSGKWLWVSLYMVMGLSLSSTYALCFSLRFYCGPNGPSHVPLVCAAPAVLVRRFDGLLREDYQLSMAFFWHRFCEFAYEFIARRE